MTIRREILIGAGVATAATFAFAAAAQATGKSKAAPRIALLGSNAVWMQSPTVGLAGVRTLSAKVDWSITYAGTREQGRG